MLKLEEIALLLNTANIGIYNPSNNILNNIFLGRVGQNRENKDEIIVIYGQENSTEQPEAIGLNSTYENEVFEILIVWNTSYNESEEKAYEVRDFFLNNRSFTLDDNSKIININVAKPIHLGISNNNNSQGFKISFNLQKTKI